MEEVGVLVLYYVCICQQGLGNFCTCCGLRSHAHTQTTAAAMDSTSSRTRWHHKPSNQRAVAL